MNFGSCFGHMARATNEKQNVLHYGQVIHLRCKSISTTPFAPNWSMASSSTTTRFGQWRRTHKPFANRRFPLQRTTTNTIPPKNAMVGRWWTRRAKGWCMWGCEVESSSDLLTPYGESERMRDWRFVIADWWLKIRGEGGMVQGCA